MANQLAQAREQLIQEIGRLSAFAGFNKAMGQIYGLLYLTKDPLSLGEIAEQLDISKGNASLNIKTMQRWGLIQPVSKKGDRRDYYLAETDFGKIVQDILTERDKKEFDHALEAISGILDSVKTKNGAKEEADNRFYQERLGNLLAFGKATNQMVQAFINMGNIRNNRLAGSTKPEKNTNQINIVE
jgi:HTH-type transcriptional regulator, glycine betaine synthesis regulator